MRDWRTIVYRTLEEATPHFEEGIMGFATLCDNFDMLEYVKGLNLVRSMLDRSVKQALGASISQYRIMLFLSDNPRSRSTDACHALRMKPNTFSLALASLEKKGVVERQANEKDSREFFLILSDSGERALVDADSLVMSRVRALWGPLSTKQKVSVAGSNRPDSMRRPTIEYVSTIIDMGTILDTVLKTFNLSLTQYLILMETSCADGPLRPVNLMSRLNLQSNTIAAAIDKLERCELITRTRKNRESATELTMRKGASELLSEATNQLESALWEYCSSQFDPQTIRTHVQANKRMVCAYSS